MNLTESLQATAQRLEQARRNVERGEEGLRLLKQSRGAFIKSLRNTGLTYAHAKIKYDNCLDEQSRLHQAAVHELQFAEQRYLRVSMQVAQQADP